MWPFDNTGRLEQGVIHEHAMMAPTPINPSDFIIINGVGVIWEPKPKLALVQRLPQVHSSHARERRGCRARNTLSLSHAHATHRRTRQVRARALELDYPLERQVRRGHERDVYPPA